MLLACCYSALPLLAILVNCTLVLQRRRPREVIWLMCSVSTCVAAKFLRTDCGARPWLCMISRAHERRPCGARAIPKRLTQEAYPRGSRATLERRQNDAQTAPEQRQRSGAQGEARRRPGMRVRGAAACERAESGSGQRACRGKAEGGVGRLGFGGPKQPVVSRTFTRGALPAGPLSRRPSFRQPSWRSRPFAQRLTIPGRLG